MPPVQTPKLDELRKLHITERDALKVLTANAAQGADAEGLKAAFKANTDPNLSQTAKLMAMKDDSTMMNAYMDKVKEGTTAVEGYDNVLPKLASRARYDGLSDYEKMPIDNAYRMNVHAETLIANATRGVTAMANNPFLINREAGNLDKYELKPRAEAAIQRTMADPAELTAIVAEMKAANPTVDEADIDASPVEYLLASLGLGNNGRP